MYDRSQLIDDLRRTDAYAHPVETVELIETHISWILLAGEFAYKLKKPVDLGFVDFSTLDKRLHYCREEMRLNGRLAPQLYLEVIPVVLSDGRPRLFGEGETIEYAVKMRRFSQDALFDGMLARSALRESHIDQLAAEVAEFHAGTAIAPADSDYGSLDAVWSPLEENFNHLAQMPDHPERTRQVKTLKDWAQAEFAKRTVEFETRKSQGCIRECHGDLHMGNMLVHDDQALLFDCIEFNDRLRWIDVMSDVAFTVMDLQDRRRTDFAFRFLGGYLQQTGDYGGLRVLRYYLVYRALVRAKVAGIRFAQERADDNVRAQAERLLQEYLDLAQRYTQPPPRMLLITHGLSGTGKSTVTQQLLQTLPAVRARSDIERKRIFGADTPAETLYSASATEQTYKSLHQAARAAIDGGYIAIADATFLQRRWRDDFRKLAAEFDARFVILDVTAPENILRERVAARAEEDTDVSDADLAVLENQIVAREPLENSELAETITVDTDDTVDYAQLAQEILARG